jgi:menaquinone-9 beta-reductase
MIDVLISGAGPAGCAAGIVLARAGARVLMLDRARFPRPKLCGDSLNPGTLALLGRLGLSRFAERRGVPADGMIVTGARGARIESRYPQGVHGRFISRGDLDWWLVQQAIAAGVEFEDNVRVEGALFGGRRGGQDVAGVRVRQAGRNAHAIPARLTIAAEGRHSALAFGLGLAHHPAGPRRWAVGGYYERVCGMSSLGEMHVRAGRYFGLAPLPGGMTNVCLVTPDRAALRGQRDLGDLLAAEIGRDPILAPRFAGALAVTCPIALGPLAVDSTAAGMPGLLLAGDAAGFIDPMTGDGMYFAVRGGELAAESALLALAGDTRSPHEWLAAQRAREFRWKQRFNRSLRLLVSGPRAVATASRVATVWPASIRQIVRIAGDVGRGSQRHLRGSSPVQRGARFVTETRTF